MLMFKRNTTETLAKGISTNDSIALDKMLSSDPQGLVDTLRNTLGALYSVYLLQCTTMAANLKEQSFELSSVYRRNSKSLEKCVSTMWKFKTAAGNDT